MKRVHGFEWRGKQNMAGISETLWIAHEAVREAAIASLGWIGRGQQKKADAAAVDAMRGSLNASAIDGRVVIGEGERDEAPMLYIGEEVGLGGLAVDIALDPLEGTTLCAESRAGAMTVLAFAERGGLLHAPDVYMQKIAAPPGCEGVVDLDFPVHENVHRLAEAMEKPVSDVVVCALLRDRHAEMIAEIRATGARLQLIDDGDISAAVQVATSAGIDLYLGSGGAPEGVLSAAAFRCLGGVFQGRLLFRNDTERERATLVGITDFDAKYAGDDLASSDVVFAACGVTDGALVNGAERTDDGVMTQTLLLDSATGRRLLLEEVRV